MTQFNVKAALTTAGIIFAILTFAISIFISMYYVTEEHNFWVVSFFVFLWSFIISMLNGFLVKENKNE